MRRAPSCGREWRRICALFPRRRPDRRAERAGGRAYDDSEIVISDPVENRRRFAEARGASRAIDPAQTNFSQFEEHFDCYIDASGNARAIDAAIPTIRPGGIAVLVGRGGERLELPIALLQHREITLTGTFRYVNAWPAAIALISSGTVDVDSLITGRFGLADVEEALLKGKTDPLVIKTMVIPGLGAEGEG